jgi:putative transcriptional regulator
MITSTGRGQYTVTPLGVESIIAGARELKDYSEYVLNNVIGQVAIWAAIAREPIIKDETVYLTMDGGILYAGHGSGSASGTAVNNAAVGEDVGVSGLKGLIPLKPETVTLIRIPAIVSGGSHVVSADAIKRRVSGVVCVAGIEALAALKKAKIKPDVLFGPVDAAVEAAVKGVKATLVISEDLAPQAIQKLEAAGIIYQAIEIGIQK